MYKPITYRNGFLLMREILEKSNPKAVETKHYQSFKEVIYQLTIDGRHYHMKLRYYLDDNSQGKNEYDMDILDFLDYDNISKKMPNGALNFDVVVATIDLYWSRVVEICLLLNIDYNKYLVEVSK